MSDNTAVSVLLLSVLVFLFFKYCLGSDNSVGVDGPWVPPGSKCPAGTEYSSYHDGCKNIVMSSKSLSERMLLLLPYFLKGSESPR